MLIFSSLRPNLPSVTDALFNVGFGGNCQDGQSGMPLTSSYFNAVLQLFSRCLVPSGSIVMWSGASDTVPVGWALCDGQNGTPDLREKFIIGATEDIGNFPVNAAGGSTTATTDAGGDHNHGGTTDGHALTIPEMPRHSHSVRAEHQVSRVQFDTGDNNELSTLPADIQSSEEGDGDPHSHAIPDSGTHTHTFETTPPYCALFYIIKL